MCDHGAVVRRELCISRLRTTQEREAGSEARTHPDLTPRDQRQPDKRRARQRLAHERALTTALHVRAPPCSPRARGAALLGVGAPGQLDGRCLRARAPAAAAVPARAFSQLVRASWVRCGARKEVEQEDGAAGENLAERHEERVGDAAPDARAGPEVEERDREAD